MNNVTLTGGATAHAAARLARVLTPIIDSPTDPRTLEEWSDVVFVSRAALKNWCRMAGISPRRFLVFGRLLRAVCLSEQGRYKPEHLLDVVDRRTLLGLIKCAGLDPRGEFPKDTGTFLGRQVLIQDPDALREIARALALREAQVAREQTMPHRSITERRGAHV
jgi:AraC-like DNA-binding protein